VCERLSCVCPLPISTFELLYTYSIAAAGALNYPLSQQSKYVYLVTVLPLLYALHFSTSNAPFGLRRRIVVLQSWKQDGLGGNVPAQKDITPLQTILRSTYIDNKYMDRLKKDPKAQAAASKLRNCIGARVSDTDPSLPRTQLTRPMKVLGVRIKMKNPENDPVGVDKRAKERHCLVR
jgi:hypothetical protein